MVSCAVCWPTPIGMRANYPESVRWAIAGSTRLCLWMQTPKWKEIAHSCNTLPAERGALHLLHESCSP